MVYGVGRNISGKIELVWQIDLVNSKSVHTVFYIKKDLYKKRK